MQATFQLNADELGTPLVEKIRAMFAHQTIRISVAPAENGNGAGHGIMVRDLPALFASAPHLSPENAKAFAEDLAAIRRSANASLPRDPWAS